MIYRNNFKNRILATRNLPGLNDRKLVNITNINRFTIVQSQGFGEAKIPILEVVSV